MVLTVCFALSPVIGLSCHRHLADTSAKLDAGVEASGPHDFTVREQALSSLTLPASTASRPNVRDDGQRPSSEQDGDGYEVDLVETRSGIFLRLGLDRNLVICPAGTIGKQQVARRVS